MVEAVVGGPEGSLNVRKVHEPAVLGIQLTTNAEAHIKGVTVQAVAFMIFRHARQAMSGFETEFLKNFHRLARQ